VKQAHLFSKHRIDSDFNLNSNIILHLGDSYKFLSSLPSNTFTLIISSPPYNVGKEYEKETTIKEYLQNQEDVINELIRVLNSQGSLCWEVGNYVKNGEVFPLDIFYYDLFIKRGLKLRNRIIWHFGHGLHASKRFSGRYETILWFTKSDNYKFNLDAVRIPAKYPGKRYYKGPNIGKPSGNPLGKNPSDIWEFIAKEWDNELWNIPNVKSNHPEKTIHPCQFPIELVERCLLALTDENDWILDPYCGVGSTLIAGIMHNRKVTGCDKESKYIQIAKERINDYYNGKLKKRQMGSQIFVPTGKEKVSQIPEEWRGK
jgi:DNA modification methylase